MVKVEYVDSTSVTVTWGAPLVSTQNGQILGYRVLFSETKVAQSSSDPWSVMAAVPASEMIYTARGLRKWMFYNVQVLAYTAKGDGPLSDVVLVQTAEDGKISSSVAARMMVCNYNAGKLLSSLVLQKSKHFTGRMYFLFLTY